MDQHKEIGKSNGPITTVGRTPIRETDLGVYVWERANGKVLADTEGNVLNIPSEFGDVRKMLELQRAAEYWCNKNNLDPTGKAIFWDCHRCTDEEYAEQVYQMENGILPDTNIRRRK